MSKNKKGRTKVDRISSLPKNVLVRILSFLPAKEAVATSLLSKRWRPLWLYLPTLYLNRLNFGRLPFFYGFVDKVLKLVDLNSVKKFVLVCEYFRDGESFMPQKISKWINAVISSEVEHLEIHLRLLDQYELPSSVLIANNITVLKLSQVTVGPISHISLPLLQVLHLEHVYFPDVRSLEVLLSGCALLQDLVIKILYGGFHHHPLDIGGLNYLVAAEVPQFLLPLKVLSNVTFLRLRCTPFFDMQDMRPFSDDMPMFYNLSHLECVVGEWTRFANCLHNFPKLEKLVVSEPHCYKGDSTSPPEAVFNVSPCVSLHLKEFTILFCQSPESKFEMVKFVTENARVLRTVTVMGQSSASERKLEMLQKLAAKRRGAGGCSLMKEQPHILMIS